MKNENAIIPCPNPLSNVYIEISPPIIIGVIQKILGYLYFNTNIILSKNEIRRKGNITNGHTKPSIPHSSCPNGDQENLDQKYSKQAK